MRFSMFVLAIATLGFVNLAKAQDSFYADESISADLNQTTTATVIVIAGTKKGKCTPEMPMLKPNVAYEIQLQATADKTFILNSADFNMKLKAAPGKTTSQVITPTSKGDYGFTCGDEALPENKRTQGMFMVM